ncbi:MAG: SAM-dependent methyltransferase, partial [Glaciimonas sp.]|nr:SAM-dependent methyltransferase [Glaciimonas sp.]
MQLPIPHSDALAASQALKLLIAQEIHRHDGWIPFSRFMELALYAPKLGYYSGGAAKLGKDGDFTTAPEITPLFGITLANLAMELMHAPDAKLMPNMLEFGAGTGQLAFDILTELQVNHSVLDAYYIVELSAELRARQEQKLQAFPQVRWLDSLPTTFSGVVFANEVLDAMPIELVLRGEHGWLQRGVGVADAASSDEIEFTAIDRPADTAIMATLSAQIPDVDTLAVGYLTEVHPVAIGFMHSLATMLKNGAGGVALLFDYGFPAAEYYLGQRDQGTLMCHYRHHAHPESFYLPGLQDITAHVDFTAMTAAAIAGGVDVLGYTSQAAFLLNAGITKLLLRTSPENALAYLPQA